MKLPYGRLDWVYDGELLTASNKFGEPEGVLNRLPYQLLENIKYLSLKIEEIIEYTPDDKNLKGVYEDLKKLEASIENINSEILEIDKTLATFENRYTEIIESLVNKVEIEDLEAYQEYNENLLTQKEDKIYSRAKFRELIDELNEKVDNERYQGDLSNIDDKFENYVEEDKFDRVIDKLNSDISEIGYDNINEEDLEETLKDYRKLEDNKFPSIEVDNISFSGDIFYSEDGRLKLEYGDIEYTIAYQEDSPNLNADIRGYYNNNENVGTDHVLLNTDIMEVLTNDLRKVPSNKLLYDEVQRLTNLIVGDRRLMTLTLPPRTKYRFRLEGRDLSIYDVLTDPGVIMDGHTHDDGTKCIEVYNGNTEVSKLIKFPFDLKSKLHIKIIEGGVITIDDWGDNEMVGLQFHVHTNDEVIINLPNDPPKIKDFSYMFSGNDPHLIMDIRGFENWGLKGIDSVDYMLKNCSQLNIDLSNLIDSDVKSMEGMLYGCTKIQPNISKWDTEGTINMNYMLYNCSNMDDDLSVWCVPKIESKPEGFDFGTTKWEENRKPIWGTCPEVEVEENTNG